MISLKPWMSRLFVIGGSTEEVHLKYKSTVWYTTKVLIYNIIHNICNHDNLCLNNSLVAVNHCVWVIACVLFFLSHLSHLIVLCKVLYNDLDEGISTKCITLTKFKLLILQVLLEFWSFMAAFPSSYTLQVVEPPLYHVHQKGMMKEVVRTWRRDRRKPRLQCVASLQPVTCGQTLTQSNGGMTENRATWKRDSVVLRWIWLIILFVKSFHMTW